ncbi:hypothetical protein FB548_2564 [Pseudoxanthomonas sp. 3HH-4]|nr:STM4014 family protein [Pseudoxanthomonas sp. 3HH-4]TQM10363.1 hypothetical protein FB548_2564 [Pseudoxanthomonas sp. 3HH-4]
MERWLLIGPRGSRRVAALRDALQAQGAAEARLLAYETLLAEPSMLETAAEGCTQVKLESPGEAPALHAALVRSGWESEGAAGPPPGVVVHGELAWQHYWFAGFARLLEAVPSRLPYLNAPRDLLAMSDKFDCQQRLLRAGANIPALFGTVESYDALRGRIRESGCERVFLKSRYGSCGAGVLAYARHADGREVAYGSAQLEGGRVFNSLRQRRYSRNDEIARLVDALAAQGAYAEQWIPKPRTPGLSGERFDARIVAFDGRARQRVARSSAGALSNLHLGNRRGPLHDWLGDASMAAATDIVERAARAFTRSRMIGFDLIVRGTRCWLLEANGFGDLLPGLLHEGRTTYEDQAASHA